jgi:hypothetical protein
MIWVRNTRNSNTSHTCMLNLKEGGSPSEWSTFRDKSVTQRIQAGSS